MDTISFEDFQKVDIRIGTVIEASVPAWSHWVIKLVVDFGLEIGKKTVFAGMMKFYKPEDFISKQFPFVVNIEPKKIGPEGDYSEAMLLAASVPAESGKEEGLVPGGDEEPSLLNLSKSVPNGTKVR